ncbi:heme o synthase [Halomonas sp. McH1-25]|uniref:heme o synthase n=1 Tax=unclassified Halomonas TaxID=2609666 RepID=UPI001EF48C28|nr:MULTISPECIES: heme o synthase [unclassified Halomonas]MCG7598557.1 heme o synthase [Halomonas sp. McH1-25]MCP1341809.1 heme o synthase [Halomonas sp. FL8]MCP1363154.1 heme o synthase [Halomonas sp. BBD45]MCP1364650.1 heme o synthase [Halomonas sp. BBD48]
MRDAAVAESQVVLSPWQWRDLVEIGKPRVVVVMLVCAAVGMALSVPGLPPSGAVVFGLLGIGLAASGAAAFNHVLDRRLDALMVRTARRPVASRRLPTALALGWASLLSTVGVGLLAWQVNPLTAWLTLASLIGYALIYTAFLKRATPQNITIGGLAGAAPPLLGWTSVSGSVDPEALLLVLIVFAWTPPHFWALAIHKREEYARANVPMLPVTHGDAFTRLQVWLYGWLTVAVTLLPYATGMAGAVYLIGIMALNARFMQWNWRVWRARDDKAPLAAFWFSIRYILGVFALLLLDHYAALPG